ncbi:MAG: sigma 54-interacting transcriptional regulator, partial [Pseudomonadota bacterium]
EMHPRLQAKLLRAIQEKEIDRLGSSSPVKVDVRLLATSNRDMEKAVKDGDFRDDLYFRLNVMTINMPSLRDRPGDVPPLAAFFVEKYCDANGMAQKSISAEAAEKLITHHWRGNVRELENTIHRAVLLARGDEIAPDAVVLTGAKDARPANAGAGALVGRAVADVERDLIINTLNQCLGNRTQAANILGISIRTLRNKLKLYSQEGFAVPPPGGEF